MWAIFKREIASYFNTKTTLIFAICFVFLTNFLTFYIGDLFENGIASMHIFFSFHPWLYCLLLPALSTPLFTEESKKGSIEVLFSLPLGPFSLSLGKFFAAWAFVGICLTATFTLWITLNVLGSPDNLVILSGYVASFLIAGCFLVIGINISALTQSSTISFIATLTLGILVLIIGTTGNLSFVQNLLPDFLLKFVFAFDLMSSYNYMTSGLITGYDIAKFVTFIFTGIVINAVLIERKKS